MSNNATWTLINASKRMGVNEENTKYQEDCQIRIIFEWTIIHLKKYMVLNI